MEEQAGQWDAGIPGPIPAVWGNLKLYEVLITALSTTSVIGRSGNRFEVGRSDGMSK